jgi:hypothetical protein
MRAREYDTRTGRFTSRDEDEGEFEEPETFNPYNFANSNPFVYSDPSGAETLVELNVVSFIQNSLVALRQESLSYAKNYIKNKAFDALINVATEQLSGLSPEFSALIKQLGVADAVNAGKALEKKLTGVMCNVPEISEVLYIEPSINADGDAVKNGLSCEENKKRKSIRGWTKKGAARPDFILSSTPPTQVTGRGSILVGEIKLSADRLYKNYVQPGGKTKQLDAICKYASKHVETDTAVFLTVMRGNEGNFKQLRRKLVEKGISEHTLLLIYSVKR